LTVSDPSALVTCSLRTTWNWSGVAVGELPGRTTPLNVWLGVGLAGSVTIVAGVSPGSVRSPSWLASIPLSVTRVAPLSVVDPVTDIAPVVGFVSLAVQVLAIWVAFRIVFCWGSTSLIVAELVTEPFG